LHACTLSLLFPLLCQVLKLGHSYDCALRGALPPSLRVLRLDSAPFNRPLLPLPPRLQKLLLGNAAVYNQPLGALPPTLEVCL
jgi:hypothetical protein